MCDQPTDAHPVSKTTPNALHQDGHKFSFVHLVNRKNADGGENVIAARGGKYVGCQPDDVNPEDIMTRYGLTNTSAFLKFIYIWLGFT